MYSTTSYTWEREFTNFEWTVNSIFNDRARGYALIEIRFGFRSRNIQAPLEYGNAVSGLTYAINELSGTTITPQDPSTITIREYTLEERGVEWRAFGNLVIDQFNAASASLDRTTSDALLTRLEPVLLGLKAGALGATRERLNSVAVDALFTQETKDYYAGVLDDYLANWNDYPIS